MEDLKPLNTNTDSSIDTGATIEARFSDYCKGRLTMDDNALEEAMKLFNQSKHLFQTNGSSLGSQTPEEAEHYWFAFILFSVKRLSQKNDPEDAAVTNENAFKLYKILRVAKLNFVDFFKELPQFIVKIGPILSNLYGSDWETRLQAKELQANFVHLSLLSKYYKRAFKALFLSSLDNVEGQLTVATSADYISNCHRFGWLLFLGLRVHAFSRFKDLVTCTNGLVSILAILIVHIPSRFRNFSLNDSSKFVKKEGKGVDLLASLCNMYETSEEELRKTMVKTNEVVAKILKKTPSDCENGNLDDIDTEDLTYFQDLLEESSLSSNLINLEKDYDDAILVEGELDERLFINDEESLLGSSSLSGGAINMTGNKRKIESLMQSPTKTITSSLSPYKSPSKILSTPVSTAMTTAKWLRTVVSPISPFLSEDLARFLSSCDKDITSDVTKRARIILEAIFPTSPTTLTAPPTAPTNSMDTIWAEQRRLEALKLYYRVLQAMCTAESHIQHGNNLTSLLTNERFHRCMLACSAELVLATHKTVTMLFPAVLERTGITAFDLSKVIESFIRHEESLPRELRRHLNSLEERLLESMVWEKGSSMYNSLIIARPNLSSEINRLGLLADPMMSLDAIAVQCGGMPGVQKRDTSPGRNGGDLRSPKRVCGEYRSVLVERNSFASPVKDRLLGISNLKSKMLSPALQSAFASPTRPNPTRGETCAETAVNLFFSKIVKLAAVRINGIVERLQLSQEVRERVYCLFQQILGQRTALFFNRHIDQIILCCFYGVAKITQLSLTFKEIIFNYRKQPHCKPQVFRAVFVDSSRRTGRTGQDHLDIIQFYNEVFIPSVKPLLMELAPTVAKNPSHVSEPNKNDEGPCPGSPKVSSFPSLPDMSPKKVSSVHNVYVSPLRSTKMDALISHGSKSYYACVGESTHAYQSPSKDLTAINNRLNGGTRKVRGSINFDEVDVGLVSDSLVANSLYLQNGNGNGNVKAQTSQLKTE